MDVRLRKYLCDRPSQLKKAREEGVKIVGYFPGNYVPEEIIYAAGAIPVCLVQGGDAAPAEAALSVVPRLICPFARYQIGARLLKTDPYFNMLDLLIAPITCQHLKKAAEVWEYFGDLDIFKLGIPQKLEYGFELDYYTERLGVLKDKLQDLTGNTVTHEELGRSIKLYNHMRELLRQISLVRTAHPALMTAKEFIQLNHASFYADPVFMNEFLELRYNELKSQPPSRVTDAPRILLTGPNLSYGDYSVLDLVEHAGGNIVIEEIFEGMRDYWHTIADNGDLLKTLTQGYLVERSPCTLMRNSSRRKFEFVAQLMQNFQVSGVIWYELLCCETFDSESDYFSRRLSELNIPMLVLESDYSTSDVAQLRTRIETFIEIVRG